MGFLDKAKGLGKKTKDAGKKVGKKGVKAGKKVGKKGVKAGKKGAKRSKEKLRKKTCGECTHYTPIDDEKGDCPIAGERLASADAASCPQNAFEGREDVAA